MTMQIGEEVELSKPEWHVINEANVDKKSMFGGARRLSLSDVFDLGSLLVGTTVLEPWKLKELLDSNAILERQLDAAREEINAKKKAERQTTRETFAM